jgi:hypothetical protein
VTTLIDIACENSPFSNMKSLLKPSLNWLLVFVPVATVLRIWPLVGNETACSSARALQWFLWQAGWAAQRRNSPNILATELVDY